MPSAVRLRTDYSCERTSASGQVFEGGQSKSASVVAGGGSGRDETRRRCADRGHGSPDAARLGPPVQQGGARRSVGRLGERADPRGCRRTRRLNWPPLSRRVPTERSTASCAGGASIFSALFVSVSASPIMSAMSERYSIDWAFPI